MTTLREIKNFEVDWKIREVRFWGTFGGLEVAKYTLKLPQQPLPALDANKPAIRVQCDLDGATYMLSITSRKFVDGTDVIEVTLPRRTSKAHEQVHEVLGGAIADIFMALHSMSGHDAFSGRYLTAACYKLTMLGLLDEHDKSK